MRLNSMSRSLKNHHLFRGLLQSEDGVITRILDVSARSMTFQTAFRVNEHLADELKNRPEHIVFSERSRIARLGIQIKSDPPDTANLHGDEITLTQVASAVISGYPGLDEFKDFFTLLLHGTTKSMLLDWLFVSHNAITGIPIFNASLIAFLSGHASVTSIIFASTKFFR